jgi:nucleotide-binding universal stress UspA family protein
MRAFAHALAIALMRQTEFTILHVGPEGKTGIEWTKFPPVRRTLERWGLLEPGSPRSAVFDRFRVRVNKIAMRSRHPAMAVASFIDRRPHDLIVLGSERLAGSKRAFDGTRAETIANWAKTMTLFVPEKARRGIVTLEDGELRLERILVPFDAAPDCAAAVEFARRAAELLGDGNVGITLLHVGDALPRLPALPEGADWRWNVEQRSGEPVAAILSAASQGGADLIVMATAGHDSVLDALRGTTTEQVLRRAPCPVLSVPAA